MRESWCLSRTEWAAGRCTSVRTRAHPLRCAVPDSSFASLCADGAAPAAACRPSPATASSVESSCNGCVFCAASSALPSGAASVAMVAGAEAGGSASASSPSQPHADSGSRGSGASAIRSEASQQRVDSALLPGEDSRTRAEPTSTQPNPTQTNPTPIPPNPIPTPSPSCSRRLRWWRAYPRLPSGRGDVGSSLSTSRVGR